MLQRRASRTAASHLRARWGGGVGGVSFSTGAGDESIPFERAPLYPLLNNEHILPTNLPPLPSALHTFARMWITGIGSSLLRPPGWTACESTLDYPWDEVTGNPLRSYFITKENALKRGFYLTGFQMQAYTLDRRNPNIKALLVPSDTSGVPSPNEFVNQLLLPSRLFADDDTSGAPVCLEGITVDKKAYRQPNAHDRIALHSTKVSYDHVGFVPDGIVNMKPTDIRVEVEWLTHDLTGEIFELSFQAPKHEWDTTWPAIGKHMMRADWGHFLLWNREAD